MTTSRKPETDFDVSSWPELPRARGLFVTGTDTEVGKTLIAGAIARLLRRLGTDVEVFKPAATGCSSARGELVSADAEFLAACCESELTLAEIAPVRYRHALAPNVAAKLEHRDVDCQAIFDGYARVTESSEFVVVEGVGGLLCPISDELWVVHLARMMRLPVVIVARAGLGTINHTLLTLLAARRAGLDVAGVVINRYEIDADAALSLESLVTQPDAALAMTTNPEQIADLGQTKILTLVPDESESSVDPPRIGPGVEFAIETVDWLELAGVK